MTYPHDVLSCGFTTGLSDKGHHSESSRVQHHFQISTLSTDKVQVGCQASCYQPASKILRSTWDNCTNRVFLGHDTFHHRRKHGDQHGDGYPSSILGILHHRFRSGLPSHPKWRGIWFDNHWGFGDFHVHQQPKKRTTLTRGKSSSNPHWWTCAAARCAASCGASDLPKPLSWVWTGYVWIYANMMYLRILFTMCIINLAG